jgi:tungstate transport system substrate-binding protein
LKERNVALIITIVVLVATGAVIGANLVSPWAQRVPMTIQTTTSLNDSGLLDLLKPAFEAQYAVDMRWVAVGSGQALTNAANGQADLVMVHSPSNEAWFMNHTDPAQTDAANNINYAGYGIMRINFAYNYFVIVGPNSTSLVDPLHIYGSSIMNNATAIFQRIYTFGHNKTTGILFESRGDNSGTFTKEVSFWKTLKVWNSTAGASSPYGWIKKEPQPSSWYEQTGQGMGATLTIANQKLAYTLTDYATWLRMRSSLTDLMVVSSLTSPNLKNIYSVIAVDPAVVPSANFDLAKKFIYFMATKGEEIIRNYIIDGVQVFTPYLNYTNTSPSGSSIDDVYNGTFGPNLGNPFFMPISSPASCGTSIVSRSSIHGLCESL